MSIFERIFGCNPGEAFAAALGVLGACLTVADGDGVAIIHQAAVSLSGLAVAAMAGWMLWRADRRAQAYRREARRRETSPLTPLHRGEGKKSENTGK